MEDGATNTYLLILSGTGSDGSTVIADYLHAGGVCFVQDPQEAKFRGIPEAALGTRSSQIIQGSLESICEEIRSYLKADGEIKSESLEDKQVLELKAGVLNLVRKVQKSEKRGSEILHLMLERPLEQVKLHVISLDQPGSFRGLLLLIFQTMNFQLEQKEDYDPKQIEFNEVERLEMELKDTREYLQTTIEELETSNEEITSTNEELQSANEELQSTNEKLETST